MPRIREIKNRMVAVKTTARITRTMQMIATAKFTAALQRSRASRPFTDQIRQLVGEVAGAAGDVEHPLLQGPSEPANRELLLIIGSDRGLCGAYNANVLRTAINHYRELRARRIELDVEASGKKTLAFLRFNKVDVREQYVVGDKPGYEMIEPIGQHYIDDFIAGKYDAVRVASMRFVSNARQVPEVLQLLPLALPEGEETAGGHALYEFSPSGQELLSDLLPLSVKVSLFQCFSDAIVSEQVMRMIAMKAATDNANGLGKDLNRLYNRARQSRITTELTEIVSGAAALG